MSRPRESLERDSPWLLLLLLAAEFLSAEFLTQLQSKEGWMASPASAPLACRVSLAVVWVVVMAVVQFR